MKKAINYKGRCVKPTHKHTAGVKIVTHHLGSKDMAKACDLFWIVRGINPRQSFQS